MVLQAKLKDRRRPNGQEKLITYCVEMPVSYCIYSQIEEKETIWPGTSRCTAIVSSVLLSENELPFAALVHRRFSVPADTSG